MSKLTHHDLITLLLAISVMLIVSRIVAEAGKKIGLPMVMGELVVGIGLGPTIFGSIAPAAHEALFPLATNANVSLSLDAITSLSVIMLLFVTGLEVRLPLVLKQGKIAITTGLGGMILPFITGFAVAWLFPGLFASPASGARHTIFALFLGTALSISALPVIARILLDMNMLKNEIGMTVLAAAILNDLVGWIVFSFILSMAGQGGAAFSLNHTIFAIAAFASFMLVIGRFIINQILPWAQTSLSWPGGVLSFSLGLGLLCAAFTEAIHLHAILGAFIAGIAIGDSVHLREQAREIMHQFVTNFFAPLFFVSIGLKVNFLRHFDPTIVAIVLALAFLGKTAGAGLGARAGGMPWRQALTIGSGLNARGAMEIILGTLAFEAGIIQQPVLVALIVMALITSVTSAPMMRYFLRSPTAG